MAFTCAQMPPQNAWVRVGVQVVVKSGRTDRFALLVDHDIKAVRDGVGCARDAGQPSTDDCDASARLEVLWRNWLGTKRDEWGRQRQRIAH